MESNFGQLVFLGAILAICGCGGASTEPNQVNKAPNPERAVKSSPVAEIIQIPADQSLTEEAYLNAGVPYFDRPWFWNDMNQVAKALAEIAKTDAKKLPRSESPHSGRIFARLTSSQNLDFYRNRSIPLEQRMQGLLTHMSAAKQVLLIYVVAFNQSQIGDTELLSLQETLLGVFGAVNELVEEFLPTLDRDDEKYPVRMQGLEQLKQSTAVAITGSLDTITETKAYRTAELEQYVSNLGDLLPPLVAVLSKPNRDEIVVRLRRMADAPPALELKNELDDLRGKVETAINN